MKRLAQISMALAVSTALATTAFATGEGGGANSPLNTPTEQDKKDSKTLLDLLEADEQQAPGNPAKKTIRAGDFTVTLIDPGDWPSERVVPTYPGGSIIPPLGNRIDRDLDSQFVRRARLTFDTSFTGTDELRMRFVQPGQTPLETTQAQLFGAPPKDDFFADLPVFSGFEGPDGTQPPKVTTAVRDEVAVGLQVGIDTELGLRRSLDFKDLNIGYAYRDIPTEGVQITFDDAPSPQGPENKIGYEIAGFSLGLGEVIIQANTTGGPAYPEQFFPPDPNAGDPLWPCPTTGPQCLFWKFTPATDVLATVEVVDLDDDFLELVRLGTLVTASDGR